MHRAEPTYYAADESTFLLGTGCPELPILQLQNVKRHFKHHSLDFLRNSQSYVASQQLYGCRRRWMLFTLLIVHASSYFDNPARCNFISDSALYSVSLTRIWAYYDAGHTDHLPREQHSKRLFRAWSVCILNSIAFYALPNATSWPCTR